MPKMTKTEFQQWAEAVISADAWFGDAMDHIPGQIEEHDPEAARLARAYAKAGHDMVAYIKSRFEPKEPTQG